MQDALTPDYLITFRESNAQRTTILKYVLEQIVAYGRMPIYLIEQDVSAKLVDLIEQLDSPLIHYHFVENHSSFNKSWGLNIAARTSSSEQLIFADADILLSVEALEIIQTSLGLKADAINPYDTLIDLNQSETSRLLSGDRELQLQRTAEQLNRVNLGQQTPFCGGVFAITRRLFEACGGMDERFAGWGGEDDAMSRRVAVFANQTLELNHQAYHLCHGGSQQGLQQSVQYLKNCAYLSLYLEQSKVFLTSLAKADTRKIADLGKYRQHQAGLLDRTDKCDQAPLISCLCVSRERMSSLARAINCFINQDYPNKELCVIAEDDDLPTISFVEQLQSPLIRLTVVAVQPKRSLGELRNQSIAVAAGEYVCQWDDDDWYHPQRLSVQLAELQESGKAASLLARWMIVEQQSEAVYCSSVRLWEGSLLCRKDALPKGHAYPTADKGEDSPLIAWLYVQDQIAVVDQPHLYVYNISGSNTWDAAHFADIIAVATPLPKAQALLVKQRLEFDSENHQALNN